MPAVGQAAPTFTLPSQDGKPISLEQYRGKWVVLYFYPKDMTTGCTIEAHKFQDALPQFDRPSFLFLSVHQPCRQRFQLSAAGNKLLIAAAALPLQLQNIKSPQQRQNQPRQQGDHRHKPRLCIAKIDCQRLLCFHQLFVIQGRNVPRNSQDIGAAQHHFFADVLLPFLASFAAALADQHGERAFLLRESLLYLAQQCPLVRFRIRRILLQRVMNSRTAVPHIIDGVRIGLLYVLRSANTVPSGHDRRAPKSVSSSAPACASHIFDSPAARVRPIVATNAAHPNLQPPSTPAIRRKPQTKFCAEKFRAPYAAALLAAYANEALSALTGKEPKAPLAGVRMARYKMFFNPAKAIRELGLPQTPPRQAFADAIAWFRNGFRA